MNLATYARRNVFRRPGRTILTMVAVTIAVLIFCLIRTVIVEWHAGADEAASDRIVTVHKTSFTMRLPRHYVDDVRSIADVNAATWAVWFGAKDPKEKIPFFAGFAVDSDTWFDVQNEMKVPPEQLAEWKQTPNGAILGDVLAKSLDVQVGSKLVIKTDIYPALQPDQSDDWEFKVVGIYTPLRKTVDRNTLVFHWNYLNNDPRAAFAKDQVGWIVSRITDSVHSADISRKIDAKFDDRDDQTATTSERAFQLSFLGAFAALLTAFDISSIVILLIMSLILANTIAMSVRERTHEYGVLRAVGFPRRYIFGFIIGEALLVATIGGLIGAGLVVLAINHGLGPVIEDTSGIFPYFRTPVSVLAVAVILAALLGVLAGLKSAFSASRLNVTDALRRQD